MTPQASRASWLQLLDNLGPLPARVRKSSGACESGANHNACGQGPSCQEEPSWAYDFHRKLETTLGASPVERRIEYTRRRMTG